MKLDNLHKAVALADKLQENFDSQVSLKATDCITVNCDDKMMANGKFVITFNSNIKVIKESLLIILELEEEELHKQVEELE